MLFCFVILEQIFSQKGMCGMILLELCALILHKKSVFKSSPVQLFWTYFSHGMPLIK